MHVSWVVCLLFGWVGAGKAAWLSLSLLAGRKVTWIFLVLTEMQQLLTFTNLPLTFMMF